MQTPSLSRALALLAPLVLSACAERRGGGKPGADDTAGPATCVDAPLSIAALQADIRQLASPEWDGRRPGTAGDAAARDYVAARFACLGLEPLLATGAWAEPFVDHKGRQTANVLGAIPGRDAAVAHEVVLVSAHLDHFGRGRLGANDDASGLAVMMAAAAALAQGPGPRRTVIFAAFGSEESGFEGSEAFVTTSASEISPADVVFNLNLDMVGSYDQTGLVYALGTMAGTPGRRAINALVDDYPDLDIGLGDWSDLSDHVTFCRRGVPYLFFWTEDPECYHQPCDTEDRIDYRHLVEIADLTAALVSALSDTDDDLGGAVRRGERVCRG
jgi:Zn-dependent M28 family amino/carboxypeptidase